MAVKKIKEKIHMNLQVPYQVFKCHKFSKSQIPKHLAKTNVWVSYN